MSSYRKKSDWGCLAWFILAFAIIAAVLCVILLASTPSGGGGSPCQTLPNLDRPSEGNSTGPVKRGRTNGVVTYISSPVTTTAGGGRKPTPVKPGPAKTQKPPQGGSGGHHKPSKVEVDPGDCD
jgi:hypothetical protein